MVKFTCEEIERHLVNLEEVVVNNADMLNSQLAQLSTRNLRAKEGIFNYEHRTFLKVVNVAYRAFSMISMNGYRLLDPREFIDMSKKE